MRLKPIIMGAVWVAGLGGLAQAQQGEGGSSPSEATTEASPEATESPSITAEQTSEPTEAEPAPAQPDQTAIEGPQRGEAPSREFMVGVWTEDLSKCSSALDFKADGTLIGPFPRWELEDGVLTLVGSRQKIQLKVIDKDTMQSRRSDTDPPRILKRCPPR